MRKHEAIDLMKLYVAGNDKAWNKMLTDCHNRLDINYLAKVKYQLCAGMDDLAKKNLNDEKMNLWFLRLLRSLELTAKRIIKIKHPMPGDKITNTELVKFDSATKDKMLAAKRKRDQELNEFMRKSAY